MNRNKRCKSLLRVAASINLRALRMLNERLPPTIWKMTRFWEVMKTCGIDTTLLFGQTGAQPTPDTKKRTRHGSVTAVGQGPNPRVEEVTADDEKTHGLSLRLRRTSEETVFSLCRYYQDYRLYEWRL